MSAYYEDFQLSVQTAIQTSQLFLVIMMSSAPNGFTGLSMLTVVRHLTPDDALRPGHLKSPDQPPTSTHHNSTNMGDIEAALAAIELR
jgi:hypothetical protein